MEILKYLDVLIGLAVVMLLLSPMVSGFTQLWLWLCNSRAANLQTGIQRILLQLDPDPYDLYEAVEITGLAPNSAVTLQQPIPFPAVTPNATAAGSIVLTQNIAAILREAKGNLLSNLTRANLQVPALQFTPANPAAAPVIRLWVRGTDSWTLTTAPTDAKGEVTLNYRFAGPAQHSSRGFTVNPVPGTLSVTINSGALQGVAVPWDAAAGRAVYPASVQPVPASHDLKFVVTNAGAPVAGAVLTLVFERNTANHPAPPPISLSADEAAKIADSVLRHNMVGQAKFLRYFGREKGEVVEREELVRILLEFAAKPATPEQVKLQQIIAADGVPNPAQALNDIRDAAQQLEFNAPSEAAHQRLTKAILAGAPSAFVGKINTWFDQTMARTTAEYRYRAQLATIFGALGVASCVQLDSIDLLKRLSTDDKLRSALIDEAKSQQERLDNAQKNQKPDAADDNEIQLAKARRDEIEANLAKMRDPQLGVLPDHFVWQALPKARLARNPHWNAAPWKRLELALGGSLYPIQPVWSGDPLESIAAAIRNSGAPVSLTLEQHRFAEVTPKSSGPTLDRAQILLGGGDALTHNSAADANSARFDDLLFGDEDKGKCQIRVNGNNLPTTNPCTFDTLQKDLAATFTVEPNNKEDHLVLVSHRLGVVQLRTVAGNPDSNILNRMPESSRPPFHLSQPSSWIAFDWDLFWSSWRGVLLTWVLLSLGAPFWYDSLKDMLKLRSSLATQEEQARTDRQTSGPRAK